MMEDSQRFVDVKTNTGSAKLKASNFRANPIGIAQPLNIETLPFPSTRFYGSKRKQLGWLYRHLHLLGGDTVLDPFGGTGSVSLLFAAMGRNVTYNDAFRFNEISARALFDTMEIGLSENDAKYFLKNIQRKAGFISRMFKGIFFLPSENAWLDGFMAAIQEIKPGLKRDALMHCLFQACLKKRPFNLFHRANLNIRLNDTGASFGNRTTWNRPFSEHILSTLRELNDARKIARSDVSVLPSGSASDVHGEYDIVYLDPPYIHANRHTESYLFRYHFLEGLARFDEWPNLVDTTSPIRTFRSDARNYGWDLKKCDLTSKDEFREQLFDLIDRYRDATVVLSYVGKASPSNYALQKHFRSRFSTVNVHQQSLRRAMSCKEQTELLIVGRS